MIFSNLAKLLQQRNTVTKSTKCIKKGPILLHDNARPHVSQITIRKLNELGYEELQN
ncbi:Histone-lysine N-methyltransferase SETMAR [Habropoda laboriosa]|uniref:Histone-lysine N-methyltransferase SETMAR n=1 Tax=Habropoda laboriosa TaxID=597456 RepID=A0A0L7RBM9_9HYME|nr:Histone-lysine N-methyltransferase SETMAR [Habropoda laboriosa]